MKHFYKITNKKVLTRSICIKIRTRSA